MSQLAASEETQRFVDKWQGVALSERAASQEHFIDRCNLVRQPTRSIRWRRSGRGSING